MQINTGRIVILCELPDGSMRALDGWGSGIIDTEFDEYMSIYDGPQRHQRTKITVEFRGPWKLYTTDYQTEEPKEIAG